MFHDPKEKSLWMSHEIMFVCSISIIGSIYTSHVTTFITLPVSAETNHKKNNKNNKKRKISDMYYH
jgi:hypothetical protein